MASIGIALIGVLVLAAGAASALANGKHSSAYTKLDLDQCQQEPVDPDDPLESGVWWCEGYQGIKVRVAESDLRFYVSFGDGAETEPAAGQTLPGFNTIGTTLEWRLELGREDGKWHPLATILRYFVETDAEKGQFLVVTRLGPPGQVCQMGIVDAVLNPDANETARMAADQQAPGFDCANPPNRYGLTRD